MKNVFVFIITFLLMLPSMQAHTEVAVFKDGISHEDAHNEHEEEHHESDSEEEKNKEHHHHCINIVISIISLDTNYELGIFNFLIKKTPSNFYQTIYYSSYLDGVFQPPKV